MFRMRNTRDILFLVLRMKNQEGEMNRVLYEMWETNTGSCQILFRLRRENYTHSSQ